MTKTKNCIQVDNEVISDFDYYDLHHLITCKYGSPIYKSDSMNIICNLLLLANEKTQNLDNVERIKDFLKKLG